MSVRLPFVRLSPFLRCLTLALILGGSASRCLAQPEAVPPDPREDTLKVHPVRSSSGDTGYWIVSTRDSPQSFDRECPCFRPCVTRVDCGCCARAGGLSLLTQSLTPGVPICINVHGSFVTDRDVRYQSAMTYRWLKSASCGDSVQVINFAWPSARPILVATVNCDVNLLGRRAARNGWYLAELIRHLPPESPVCLIGHSHGTRLVASALHLMGGGQVQGVTHPYSRAHGRRIRTVFAAAAIRHDWLNPGERYGRAMCSTECLINLRNRHDAALALYPLRHPFSGHSLGSKGFTPRDRRDLRGWSPRVSEYDVTRFIGHAHMWPRYLEYPQLAWLIRNFVYYPETHGMASVAEQLQQKGDSYSSSRRKPEGLSNMSEGSGGSVVLSGASQILSERSDAPEGG